MSVITGFAIAFTRTGPPLLYVARAVSCRTLGRIVANGWVVRARLTNGQTVTLQARRVRDVLTGDAGLLVGKTSEGRPIVRWADGRETSRDWSSLERM